MAYRRAQAKLGGLISRDECVDRFLRVDMVRKGNIMRSERHFSGFLGSGRLTPGRSITRLSLPTAQTQPDNGSTEGPSVDDLNRLLIANKFDYVRFEHVDMHGLTKCKLVPINHVRRKLEKGINFSLSHLIRDPTGCKVDGTGLWYEKGMGDSVCKADLTSFRILPWCDRAARVIVDLTADGVPVEAHPRNIARRQVEELESMGLSLLAAHEFEFVVEDGEKRAPVFDGNNCGYLLNISRAESLVQLFARYLPQMGLDVETIESEAGPGQLEVTYRPSTGLSIGDNGHTLKTSIKEICQRNGFVASFRSKHSDTCTSSSHFCHSIWDKSNTTSLFYDPHHPQGLSTLGQHWLAGLVHHAPALTLLLCPTVNCLDRIGTSLATPTTVSWGVDNRSCAFRLSLPTDKNPNAMFIENRIAGAGSNPYLTLAANIAAGIDGIRRQLLPPAPTQGIAPTAFDDPARNLPRTMSESIDALLADDVISDAVGPDFVKCFVALKQHEMKLDADATKRGDTSWRHSYFEHI